jgi:hypothetical protein
VTYATATAFRQALEERLRRLSLESNTSLSRLRKLVAFDRLLARMVAADPGLWILKGGYALEMRLGARARTTRDVDAAVRVPLEEAPDLLAAAAWARLDDWFEFEVGRPDQAATGAPQGGLRFPIRCLLDGRVFESFHLDVGAGDPLPGEVEYLTGPPLLEFAGIAPARVPAYPLAQQLAEKVHAFTRRYGSGEASRVRDLIDILLIGQMCDFPIEALRDALTSTFVARNTHPLPEQLATPPRSWSRAFSRLAAQLDVPWSDLADAAIGAKEFLDPVLSGQAGATWNSVEWRWVSTE